VHRKSCDIADCISWLSNCVWHWDDNSVRRRAAAPVLAVPHLIASPVFICKNHERRVQIWRVSVTVEKFQTMMRGWGLWRGRRALLAPWKVHFTGPKHTTVYGIVFNGANVEAESVNIEAESV
jgi:hypothetical protein